MKGVQKHENERLSEGRVVHEANNNGCPPKLSKSEHIVDKMRYVNWLYVNLHESEKYFSISVFENEYQIAFNLFHVNQFCFSGSHVEEMYPRIDRRKYESYDGSCRVYVWETWICMISRSKVHEL